MPKKIERDGRIYWVDAQGDEIPESYVTREDKKRDRVVESVLKDALRLHNEIMEKKAKMTARIDEYLESVAGSYGEKWKGNASIPNFAGDKMIEISIKDLIEFDEKLQIAKQKIDRCIHRWTENTNEALEKLVTKAFRTDAKGKLNKKLILQLLSYNIKDAEWVEAMEIIRNSIRVVNSNTYYNFSVRDEDGRMKQISLNFSRL